MWPGMWNARFGSRPVEIVSPTSATEVASALLDTLARGLPFRIRSGGHSIDGFSSVDGGVVIDLRMLKSIDVSPESGLATVGAGVTIGEINAALDKVGCVVPTGIGDTVGLGGHITGGGLGALARWLGSMADNVVS